MSHTGGGFSSSGSFGAQGALNAASTLMSAVGSSGHAQGTTQAAVSEGTITVRDKANQRQDVDGLQRDVTQANDAISPIFNKEKEQTRLQIAQMTGDIAGQMTSMVMTEGNISALKAARAVPGNANLSAEELKQTQAYQDAFRDYGTGGKDQQIAQSASAAIAGLVNGDYSGAVAGAAAPFIATFVKKHTDEDSAQRILAHALAGAVIAKAQGKDALAGAAGASTGELTAKLALDLYGKKPEQLGESERQLVSSLSSVAAGLAGAAVSDNTAGVQTAAQAGKNAVENNFLTRNDITGFLEKYAKAKTEEEKKQLLSDLKELDASQQHAILAWSITIKDQKEELQNLKTLQASSQCDSQCQKLVAYSISELEPVINDKNLYRDAKREALLFSIIQELQMGGFLPKSSKAPQSAVSVSNTGKTTINSVVKSGEQASKSIARSEAELLSDTSKQLEKYVNAFANSKYKPATAIGALDPLTGKIVTTSNGSVPTIIAPELQAYADRLGGLGVKTACGNTLGRCAEFRAANELLLANPSLKVKDIQFTPAIWPRTGEVVPRFENCKNIFGGE